MPTCKQCGKWIYTYPANHEICSDCFESNMKEGFNNMIKNLKNEGVKNETEHKRNKSRN